MSCRSISAPLERGIEDWLRQEVLKQVQDDGERFRGREKQVQDSMSCRSISAPLERDIEDWLRQEVLKQVQDDGERFGGQRNKFRMTGKG